MVSRSAETDTRAAFAAAAAELGFHFSSPFLFSGHSYLGLVHDFGSPKGTVISLQSGGASLVMDAGYYWSELGEPYRTYERQLFVDTLNDWGYFGSQKPSWYTGKAWS